MGLARYLEKKVGLDQPLNIHLTGCPNSCAQHYIGDIGLLGAKITRSGTPEEGYHVLLGGQSVAGQALGREVFHGIPFTELPALLEKVLTGYLARRAAWRLVFLSSLLTFGTWLVSESLAARGRLPGA